MEERGDSKVKRAIGNGAGVGVAVAVVVAMVVYLTVLGRSFKRVYSLMTEYIAVLRAQVCRWPRIRRCWFIGLHVDEQNTGSIVDTPNKTIRFLLNYFPTFRSFFSSFMTVRFFKVLTSDTN